MKQAWVIGDPIEHSLSPPMHNAGFAACHLDAIMDRKHVSAADLASEIETWRLQPPLGVSVTIPHKQTVAALCDRLDESAQAIGAVNCLQFSGNRIVGHNTDGSGFRRAARDKVGRGQRVIILGSGGAARAVAWAMAPKQITVVSRRPSHASFAPVIGWDDLFDVDWSDVAALIDCTPVALGKSTDGVYPSELPLASLAKDCLVAGLVYHRVPQLISDARQRGLPTLTGRDMLLYQGAIAFELWTGLKAPIDAMSAALPDPLS